MARPRKSAQIEHSAFDNCLDKVIHIDVVREVLANQPDTDDLEALANLFSAISDPTRLRLLTALATADLCVCDLSATIGASESATSHHLRLLRDRGLVRFERRGRLAFYSIDDEHVRTLLSQGREHVGHKRLDA